MGTVKKRYPSFKYSARQLSAFACSLGNFTISLKNGTLVSFRPIHPEDFRNWLIAHGIRDIQTDGSEHKRKRSSPFPFLLSRKKIKIHESARIDKDCID
jgi:hypothetical protein